MKLAYLFFFVFVCASIPSKCLSDLITTTCDRTTSKDLCNSILKNHHKGTNNLQGLATITLHVAISHATRIQNQINITLTKTSQNLKEKKVLEECLQNFDMAVQSTKDSVNALSLKRYPDVVAWISGAQSQVNYCVDSLTEMKIFSPLSDKCSIFLKICSIELRMIYILTGTEPVI
ncbi:hypothetical protein ACFE04_001137 [Oxalis oulophora]